MAMDFSKIVIGAHVKNNCTPIIPENEKEGIWINFPKEINWGDPLPVCGLLRFKKDYLKNEKHIRFYFTFEKPITFNSSIMGQFREDKAFSMSPSAPADITEAVFNLDALENISFIFPPGRYKFMAEGLWGLYQKDGFEFHIKSTGWRKDYVERLRVHFCEKNMRQDFDRYFKRLSIAQKEDLPEGQDRVVIELKKMWYEAIKNHKELELPKEGKEKDLLGLAFYLKESMSENCKIKLGVNDLEIYFQTILSGLLSHGVDPKN